LGAGVGEEKFERSGAVVVGHDDRAEHVMFNGAQRQRFIIGAVLY